MRNNPNWENQDIELPMKTFTLDNSTLLELYFDKSYVIIDNTTTGDWYYDTIYNDIAIIWNIDFVQNYQDIVYIKCTLFFSIQIRHDIQGIFDIESWLQCDSVRVKIQHVKFVQIAQVIIGFGIFKILLWVF